MTYEIDMQTKLWLRELEKKLGRKLEAECLRLGSIMSLCDRENRCLL